ncbi:hypothetical protein Tco_0970212 [Tanacetum coccineum]
MKTRLARKTSLKKKGVHKEYVSKQGRKSVKTFKGEPSVHKDLAFDDLDDFVDVDDTLDYMETEDVQDERRNEGIDKGNEGTDKGNEGTDKGNEGTDKQDGGTDSTKVSTDRQDEGTADQNEGKSATQIAPTPTSTPTPTTPTPTVFGDDETIAQVLIIISQNKEKLKEKEKGIKAKRGLKRQNQNFVAIRSAEDERQIKELNKDPEKKRLKKRVVNKTPRKEDTAKVHAEQEVTKKGTKKRKSGHVKMIARKRPRPQPDDDSDDEHRKCLRILIFEGTIDSEIMETKSFIARLHKVSSPDGNYLVVYRVNGHFKAFNYLMEIMMESLTEENDQGDFWNNQQEWEVIRWRLYEACRVCILELKDGTIIYMLVERRYPLSKELLQQMIDLGLEVEEESTVALQLGSQLTLLHSKELASPGSNSSCKMIQQQAAPVVETTVGKPLGLGYGALRRREIASREGRMPSVFEVGQGSGSVPKPKRLERVSALRQPTLTTWIDPKDGIAYIDVPAYPLPAPPVQTPPSPEWSSGLLPISLAPSIISSPISSPMIPLTVPLPIASPVIAEIEGF